MAEIEKTGVIFRVLSAISPITWNKISFWTKAKDVIFDETDLDAYTDSLQSKIGAIAGISSDTAALSEDVAASLELVNGYNNDCPIQVSSTDWSIGTTNVNGSDYHYVTKHVGKVWSRCPICMLTTTIPGEVIPTASESSQFNKVSHIVGDTTENTITFYAKEIPTVNLKIIVKGVVS